MAPARARGVPFEWTVLGGAWTKRHVGVAYDSFQARAAGREAQSFCQQYALQQTHRFSCGVFGEATCAILCEYVVSKLTFFYDIWIESSQPLVFRFSPSDLEGFQEAEDFAALAAVAQGQLAKRVQALRSIVPRDIM